MATSNAAAPTLNWKEISILAAAIRPQIEGLFVDRIIVPDRGRFPGGYLKGEWAIRLTGRREEGVLLFSVRTRHPYFYFIAGKGPKAAPLATRSPFDLEVTKFLKGQKLILMETLPRERTVILWFSDPEGRSSEDRLGLVWNLIPAAPEALLVRRRGDEMRILTRSRVAKGNSDSAQVLYIPPDGSKAPESPPVRDELVTNGDYFTSIIEKGLESEAFDLRLAAALREIRSLAKQAHERVRQTETTLREAERDQDWQRFGNLLKASLHEQPEIQAARGMKGVTHVRRVRDYETEAEISLPADPKLGLSEQVEKYYQLARRKSRRISEATTRLESLSESHSRFQALIDAAPQAGRWPPDWKDLEKLERAANLTAGAAPAAPVKGSKKAGAWLGKTFTSKEGLLIYVGRSKDENLELTFKHSRGNDIWLHVRGRPGSHVLIPLQPGKSAPLETLLDAATLCIYYSGGEKWGKTEVDYTFKKYVRRIKDSTEASYTNNKTLLVEPDPARLKRLLDSAG